MEKIIEIIKKANAFFGIGNEQSAVETLVQVVKEQEHITLLRRIEDIRLHSLYVPDYNLPRVHTDVVIKYDEGLGNFKPISSNTRLAQPRPVDFGNDIQRWYLTILAEHLNEKNIKKAKAEAIEKQFTDREEYVNRAMLPYLRVN